MIIITNHAYLRASERLNFDKTGFKEIAIKAFNFGISNENITGHLRGYLDKIQSKCNKNTSVKIYGTVVYIFAKKKLVTILTLKKKECIELHKMYNRVL